jgi:hypothetical protein
MIGFFRTRSTYHLHTCTTCTYGETLSTCVASWTKRAGHHRLLGVTPPSLTDSTAPSYTTTDNPHPQRDNNNRSHILEGTCWLRPNRDTKYSVRKWLYVLGHERVRTGGSKWEFNPIWNIPPWEAMFAKKVHFRVVSWIFLFKPHLYTHISPRCFRRPFLSLFYVKPSFRGTHDICT